jgi:hypothetical protein
VPECPMVPYKHDKECSVFCAWYDPEYKKCAVLMIGKMCECIAISLDELREVIRQK